MITTEVYTVKDIQAILNISRNTAYELVEESQFPIKRIGNTIQIPKEPFHRWLNTDSAASEEADFE